MLVSICVITFNRPEGLRRLLEGLHSLTFQKIVHPEIEVIVVDNDTQGLAEQICSEIKEDFKWVLKTGVQTIRGISYARNKSLSLVDPHSDFIAMIDDDEKPKPEWLEELLLSQQNSQADIVSAPVHSIYPENTPKWIVRGNFFHPQSFPEGALVDVAFTSNVLIKAEIIRKLDRFFDHRFALTGGEDSEFFMRLYEMNYKIVWSEKAIVEEWVSPKKTNLLWILKSGYRCWSTHSLLEKEFYPSSRVQLLRIIKGTALIILGLLKIVPSAIIWFIQGKQPVVSSLLSIFRGAGTFAGLLGISNYKLYENPK